MAMVSLLWILIGIVAIVVFYIVYLFNRLIVLRNRADNALSQIDIQLKRRYDLIPNLINTVKGYMKHEKTVLENITKARASLVKGDINAKMKASDSITSALKTLFAVAENYPNLKASDNFKMLQEELSGTEDKIAYSRQFYSDTVMDYNNRLQTFPSNMFAKMLKFSKKEFFKTQESEKKAVKVSL